MYTFFCRQTYAGTPSTDIGSLTLQQLAAALGTVSDPSPSSDRQQQGLQQQQGQLRGMMSMDKSAAAAGASLRPPSGLNHPQAHGNSLMVLYTMSCAGPSINDSAAVAAAPLRQGPAVSTVPRPTVATQQLSELSTPVSRQFGRRTAAAAAAVLRVPSGLAEFYARGDDTSYLS